MNRVRTVHSFRAWLASPLAGMALVLVLVSTGGALVSLRNIAVNTFSHADWGEDAKYVCWSLLHARTIVQILFAAVVLVAGLVFWNSVRTIRHSRLVSSFR